MKKRKKLLLGILVIMFVLVGTAFAGTKYLSGNLASLYIRGPFTTLTVTKTADTLDGSCDAQDCSLREAVQVSWDRSTDYLIRIPAGTYTLTLPNASGSEFMNVSGDLNVQGYNHTVVIQGSSRAPTIIDGGGVNMNDRIFGIFGDSTGSVVLSNLTIQNGYMPTDLGGGISNTGAVLVLTGVIVDNNYAHRGGNILSNNGNMTILHSVVSNGESVDNGGGIAVYNGGNLTISSSEVSNNISGVYGGGIYNNAGTVTINGSEISSNSAVLCGGGIVNDAGDGDVTVRSSSVIMENTSFTGGGIYNSAGGTLLVDSSTIKKNVASNGVAGNGGGIFNAGVGAVTSVKNSKILANEAFSEGGGFYNSFDGSLTVYSSHIDDNEAGLQGGGGSSAGGNSILNIDNSVFDSNTSQADAGALYNASTTGIIINSSFISNTAIHSGGAIFNGVNGGTLTISTSNFKNNKTLEGCLNTITPGDPALGGAVVTTTCYMSLGGGAIMNDSDLIINQSLFTANNTNLNGGAIYNASRGALDLTNSTLYKNKTLSAGTYGGGIFNLNDAILNISFTTITGNSSYNGSGIYNYNSAGIITVKNSILSDNLNSSTSANDNCSNMITSIGYNIDDGTTCRLTGTGDLSSTNPLVAAALASNGGLTQTLALQVGSPAIDHGVCTDVAGTAVTIDQRGSLRGALCDIGAYEVK